MKVKWNEINSRLENIEAVNSRILEHIKLDKVKSAQERLALQYKRFCTILPNSFTIITNSRAIKNWLSFAATVQ